MEEAVYFINKFFAYSTLLTQIVILLLIFALITYKKNTYSQKIIKLTSKYSIFGALAIIFIAIITSIFYSSIVGYEVCSLCWYQRMFMYPQLVLIILALWLKDKNLSIYSISLSIIGILIGIYNQYLQLGGSEFIPCSKSGASCAKRYIFEFGYITIPMMSITAFALIIALMLCKRKYEKNT
jgi:disulfide bond formation protein DsbB